MIGAVGGAITVVTIARAKLRASAPPPAPAADTGELSDLRDTVQRLSGDLADLQERVDFAERLLSKQRDAERLKGER